MKKNKIGFGYDVHKYKEGDSIRLCGIDIDHNMSLEGHSDADVGLHALCDAIYGSIGEGDIGFHFPPTDKKYKDEKSLYFLKHARDLLDKKGGIINNIDVTLVCETPMIRPYVIEMKKILAQNLKIKIEDVSVKATTSEKMSFIGRKEGMAAYAIVSIEI